MTSDDVGLCERCKNARIVGTAHSRFWLCQLHKTDPRFDKYPRLPVRECDGFELLMPDDPPRTR